MSSSKITGHDIDPQYKLKQLTVILPHSNWKGTTKPYVQTVSIQGITETNIVIVSPKPTQSNIEMIGDCKIVMTEQMKNSAVLLQWMISQHLTLCLIF